MDLNQLLNHPIFEKIDLARLAPLAKEIFGSVVILILNFFLIFAAALLIRDEGN